MYSGVKGPTGDIRISAHFHCMSDYKVITRKKLPLSYSPVKKCSSIIIIKKGFHHLLFRHIHVWFFFIKTSIPNHLLKIKSDAIKTISNNHSRKILENLKPCTYMYFSKCVDILESNER